MVDLSSSLCPIKGRYIPQVFKIIILISPMRPPKSSKCHDCRYPRRRKLITLFYAARCWSHLDLGWGQNWIWWGYISHIYEYIYIYIIEKYRNIYVYTSGMGLLPHFDRWCFFGWIPCKRCLSWSQSVSFRIFLGELRQNQQWFGWTWACQRRQAYSHCSAPIYIWLVVWNIFYFSICWG